MALQHSWSPCERSQVPQGASWLLRKPFDVATYELTSFRDTYYYHARVKWRELGHWKDDEDHPPQSWSREQLAASTNPPIKQPHQQGPLTAAALLTKSQPSGPSCVYCGQSHPSSLCATLTNVDECKEVLRKAGRCYLCLRKHHLSRNCRSSNNCSRCGGRHHISLWQHSATSTAPPQSPDIPPVSESTAPPQSQDTPLVSESTLSRSSWTNNAMCIDSQTPLLLQTAKLRLCNLQDEYSSTVTIAQAILDSGKVRNHTWWAEWRRRYDYLLSALKPCAFGPLVPLKNKSKNVRLLKLVFILMTAKYWSFLQSLSLLFAIH